MFFGLHRSQTQVWSRLACEFAELAHSRPERWQSLVILKSMLLIQRLQLVFHRLGHCFQRLHGILECFLREASNHSLKRCVRSTSHFEDYFYQL